MDGYRAFDYGRVREAHPNLYVELAGELEYSPGASSNEQVFLGGNDRDQFAYPDGGIREEWRSIFEKYSDRFITGFDFFTQSAYKFESIKTRVNYWRNLLGQLNQEPAEKIAYKNVEEISQAEFRLRGIQGRGPCLIER